MVRTPASALKLGAQGFEIELGFEVMHCRPGGTISPCRPHHRPTVPRVCRSAGDCGRNRQTAHRREIDVIKGDDVRDGLRENLRPPACFAAGVESVAENESRVFSQMRISGAK